MNEELLSAMMDGEVSAFETRRALNHLSGEPKALARWERYHLMRSVLQNAMPAVAAQGFAERVMSQLGAEPPPRSSLQVLKPLLGYAAAAGVVAVAAFGWWQTQPNSTSPISVAAFSEQNVPVVEVARFDDESPRAEDESARLNSYLVNHSEHAAQGMMPYVRLVGFSTNRP